MREVTKRSIQECVLFGLVAAPVLMIAEVVAYVALGLQGERPLRLAASLVAGSDALVETDGASVMMVGFMMSFGVAAVWGVLYGILHGRVSQPLHRELSRFGPGAVLGLCFGVLVWALTFPVLGRLGLPWMLDEPQGLQLVLHTLFFGLPMGLFYARAERRVPDLEELPH